MLSTACMTLIKITLECLGTQCCHHVISVPRLLMSIGNIDLVEGAAMFLLAWNE